MRVVHSSSILASVLLLVVAATSAEANELRIETGRVWRPTGATSIRIEAIVRWKNGWRNARNYDAAWLVVKLRGEAHEAWLHGRLSAVGITNASPAASCSVSRDQIGAFCIPAESHRGDVEWHLTLDVIPGERVDEERIASGTLDVLVFGVEMVYIPAGPFTIGDPDASSVDQMSYYRSDAQGRYAGTYRLTSEDEIPVGPHDGSLYCKPSRYGGDCRGPIPGAFPKGTRAFYVMKYEILQGQYADFLNTIHYYAASFRAPIGGRDYYEQRGSIRVQDGRYVAMHPDRPANFMSWDDGTAFADWAGLRPWTEFEFTKAARGPVEPIADDFPWGTASKERLLRRNQPNDELFQSGDADESNLTDETRDVFGASYFWVMDLAGSVWEKVVSAAHPTGRAFIGTHGDGRLASYGLATSDDWPRGDHEGGGYGYRGGGYYERGHVEGPLNPHSRVAQRPYGGWGGGPRGVAYGFRAARTAGS